MSGTELIIRDDDGNIIPYSHEHIYELNIGSGDSDTTEGAVEKLRHKYLKDMHKKPMSDAQRESESQI